MYDMYPEWGPAAHDPEHPRRGTARRHPRRWEPHSAAASLARPGAPDQRDAAAERPDDH